MKSCVESDNIFHLIGLIAASESIISDRLSAFLGGTKNEKHKQAIERNKFISFGDLLKYSKKGLKGKIEIKQKVGGIITIENFGKQNYFSAMYYSAFLLGNTSSGILEAATFEKYVVNVGDRQKGRLQSKNIINAKMN